MVATDSYRLAVKRTELEEPVGAGARGEHPGPGAARAGADRRLRGGRGGRGRAAAATRRLPRRRGRPLDAADRGPVPELPPALPESYEHDVRLPREEFLDVGAAGQPARAAQRAAAPRLRAGELTVAAETPEVGDASETMPAPFRASRSRSASTRSSSRRGSRASRATRWCCALISPLRPGPAAAGRAAKTSATW